MQPIASPDRTIDKTIGSRGAVAGSKIERALFKRVGLAHDHFVVGIAVAAVRSEADGAVDTRIGPRLVPVTGHLLGVQSAVLYGFGNHEGRVIADADPPQQRIVHLDLGGL